MKLFCVALLMVAVSSSQADDCEDNRPEPKSGLNKDDHPDCFKTCAEYKAMGACNSVWNTCVSDESGLAEKEINESCSCSCSDCMRNSRGGCQIDNKTLDGYTDGGRKAFCKTCYTPAKKMHESWGLWWSYLWTIGQGVDIEKRNNSYRQFWRGKICSEMLFFCQACLGRWNVDQ